MKFPGENMEGDKRKRSRTRERMGHTHIENLTGEKRVRDFVRLSERHRATREGLGDTHSD